VSLPGHALSLGKGPPVPIVQEAGWAPEPVWTQRLEEKSFRLCQRLNLDHPARSQTLYWLSYLAQFSFIQFRSIQSVTLSSLVKTVGKVQHCKTKESYTWTWVWKSLLSKYRAMPRPEEEWGSSIVSRPHSRDISVSALPVPFCV
jgi:hypothetical protein